MPASSSYSYKMFCQMLHLLTHFSVLTLGKYMYPFTHNSQIQISRATSVVSEQCEAKECCHGAVPVVWIDPDWSPRATLKPQPKCKEQIYFTIQFIFHSSWPLSLSTPHFQYRFLLKVCHSQEVFTVLLKLCSHQHLSVPGPWPGQGCCSSGTAHQLLALWEPTWVHFWRFWTPQLQLQAGEALAAWPLCGWNFYQHKKGVQKRVLGSTICSGF